MLALKLRLALATCCAALVFPAGAAAIHCAPPGVAGLDQYFMTIPASACNGSATGAGPAGHHTADCRIHRSRGAGGRRIARARRVPKEGRSPMTARITLALMVIVPAVMTYPWHTTTHKWVLGTAVGVLVIVFAWWRGLFVTTMLARRFAVWLRNLAGEAKS